MFNEKRYKNNIDFFINNKYKRIRISRRSKTLMTDLCWHSYFYKDQQIIQNIYWKLNNSEIKANFYWFNKYIDNQYNKITNSK